jgi:hypothetical protein
LSTPRPEPVRTQSCARDKEEHAQIRKHASRKPEALAKRELFLAEGGINILFSSIRWRSALESGEKDTAYDSIVVRYVLLGKLRSIMRGVWNLKNNRVNSLDPPLAAMVPERSFLIDATREDKFTTYFLL